MVGWVIIVIGLNGQITLADKDFSVIYKSESACMEAVKATKDDRNLACTKYDPNKPHW